MFTFIAILALHAQIAPAQAVVLPDDSVARLRSQARSAEAAFERLSRNLAPYTWGGFDSRFCDEIVGRFCLRFDSASARPPAGEAGRVVDERRSAVETLRQFFAAAPHDRAAAGPLTRLLVNDGRAPEAVSAARAFAALSPDTLWGQLLLGFSHNAAGETVDAERAFVQAFARMDNETRRAWTDPQWLLDGGEVRRVRGLSPEQRTEYERRFWILSDPLWLTDANERWIEHMSRHVEASLMDDVPVVGGMLRWGRDLDELTIRYGTPSARAQVRGNQPWDPSSFVEYFDTAQRAYTPERLLTGGLPDPPAPGDPPLLYSARARSGYALRTVHRLVDLPHQVTRFMAPDGQVILRVDAALPRPPPDTAGEPIADTAGGAPADTAGGARADTAAGALGLARVQVGLFVYDSAFTRRTRVVQDAGPWPGDTLRFTLTAAVRPDRLVYSVEALDTVSRVAGRARYAVDAFVPGAGLLLSDLLIARPFGTALPRRRDDPLITALTDRVVPRGGTLGVYAEVYRLDAAAARDLTVEFSLEPADGEGVLGRFARWLGRRAGVVGPREDPRVSWLEEIDAGVHAIAVNLPLDRQHVGRRLLVLRVTDPVTGETTESERLILIR
jgi:hypothetical protein